MAVIIDAVTGEREFINFVSEVRDNTINYPVGTMIIVTEYSASAGRPKSDSAHIFKARIIRYFDGFVEVEVFAKGGNYVRSLNKSDILTGYYKISVVK